jgi:hypothetical protein
MIMYGFIDLDDNTKIVTNMYVKMYYTESKRRSYKFVLFF